MATKNSVSNQAKYFYHACPWNKLMIHKDISDGSICSTCTRKLGKGSIRYINLNNIRPDHWPINYTDMIIKKIKKASIVPQIFLGPDPIRKNIWNLFMNYDGSRWFGSWVGMYLFYEQISRLIDISKWKNSRIGSIYRIV